MIRKSRLPLAASLLFLISLLGCATATEVRRIVAESNVAMVDVPGLETVEDPSDPDKWKEPVARIERLVAQHPDQKALVSALRVRQALLLTVYGQFAAAQEAWDAVPDASTLGGRDAALYALRKDLVWWFDRAGTPTFGNDQLGTDQRIEDGRAREALDRFEQVCDGLAERSEIRDYLETMRAMIAVKAARSVNTTGNEERKARVSELLVAALKRFASRYDATLDSEDDVQSDLEWLLANGASPPGQFEQPLDRLRARVWLAETVAEYHQTAEDKQLVIAWVPDWLRTDFDP